MMVLVCVTKKWKTMSLNGSLIYEFPVGEFGKLSFLGN